MKNFLLIGSFDPMPLLHQLHVNADLWNQNTLRTTHEQSPHTCVDDIWIRFNDLKSYEASGDASKVIDEHESIWYPAIDKLPIARGLLMQHMVRVGAIRLGRVLVTRLAPGKSIAEHVDGGSHAAYYSRYHYVLQGLPGSQFQCGAESVEMRSGQIYWFNNSLPHSVHNNSADDRIHMIVDAKL